MNTMIGALVYVLFHTWFPACTVEVYWVEDDVLVQESPETCASDGQVHVQDARGMVRTCSCQRGP